MTNKLPSNLKRLREQRVLSLSDLARISGVNRITINRIENGKQNPIPRTIRKLAKALGVSPEDLTSGQKPSYTEGNNHEPSE